jgi:TonB-dependent SusC/RagA subfamily outer membrane receptor
MTLRLSSFDRKHYQYSLLRVSDNAFQIVNHFHLNNLKKRIIMMNKKESPRIMTAKYLLVIPALTAALLIVQISGLQASKSTVEESLKVVPTVTESPNVKSVESPVPAKAPLKKSVKAESVARDTVSSGKPLIIIQKVISNEELHKIDPSNIESMNILKDITATDAYGDAGANGVIIVTLKEGANSKVAAETMQISGCVTNEKTGKPLPGVAILVKGGTLGTVTDTEGKYTMNVPADATLKFSYINMATQEIAADNRQQINVSMFEKFGTPLYFVDGKEVSDIGNISPNSIESISILKDKSATDRYGDKGKNGVVLVTLKK